MWELHYSGALTSVAMPIYLMPISFPFGVYNETCSNGMNKKNIKQTDEKTNGILKRGPKSLNGFANGN